MWHFLHLPSLHPHYNHSLMPLRALLIPIFKVLLHMVMLFLLLRLYPQRKRFEVVSYLNMISKDNTWITIFNKVIRGHNNNQSPTYKYPQVPLSRPQQTHIISFQNIAQTLERNNGISGKRISHIPGNK